MQGMGKALTDSMMRSLTYTLNTAKTPSEKIGGGCFILCLRK